MKLKRSLQPVLWSIALLSLTIGCGFEIPELAEGQGLDQEAAFAGEEGVEVGLYGDESQDYADEAAADEQERSASEIATVDLFIALHDQARLSVADCAGILEPVSAFMDGRNELKVSGASKEEIREAMKEEHLTIKSLMDENKEKIKECRESNKESEVVVGIKSLLDACFDKPERKKKGKKGRKGMDSLKEKFASLQGDSEVKSKRRGKGKKKRGLHKLPPRKFGNFESAQCMETVEALQILVAADETEAVDAEISDSEEDQEESQEETQEESETSEEG